MQALRVFCEVAELRSFSAAADRLGISQSAVSQRVRQLEERLQAVLLDRSVRPFTLTAEGTLLAREGREILKRYDDLERRVARGVENCSGEIRVDAIYSAGIGLLSKLRQRFLEAQPEVNVQLEYKRPEQVAEAVREKRCDLGIISYPRRWPEVSARMLRAERMCVVCSAQHQLVASDGPSEIHVRELAHWQIIGFEPDLPVARAIRRYLRDHGVGGDFSQHVDNIDTMKAMLAETEEVAILPERTVEREVDAGVLATLALQPVLTRPLGIIQARGSALSSAAQTFVDFLLEDAASANDCEPSNRTKSSGLLVAAASSTSSSPDTSSIKARSRPR